MNLQQNVEKLLAALDLWATRDDSKAQPGVRGAANDAIDAIDALSRELYALRQQLVGEAYEADEAAMKRSAELLAKVRKERES